MRKNKVLRIFAGTFLFINMFIGVILIFFSFVSFLPQGGKIEKANYYLPDDFRGCAYIFYNIEGAPPLRLTDEGVINYYFNEEGILLTSSPQDFGWEGKTSSGLYVANYYAGNLYLNDKIRIAGSSGDGFIAGIGKYYIDTIRVGTDRCLGEREAIIKVLQNR